MASREQDKTPDKAIDGLLRRSLARTTPSRDCPGPDILAAYYDRALDAQETARYDLHFSTCPHCRTQLAAMVRADEPEVPGKQSSGWGWLTHRWWFVPALATATLALVVSVPLARRIYNPPAPAQQVAMNSPAPAAAPASEQAKGSPRDSETAMDKPALGRLGEKTAPSGAPTASNFEKRSKDERLVVPQAASPAKPPTLTPAGSMSVQVTEAAPLIENSQTDRLEAADSAPAPPSSAASRRAAPAQSAGARSSGDAAGLTARNQVQNQNQTQNQQQSQPQNQPQNEVAVQAQSETVQVQAQQAPQTDSVASGVAGGVAESAPRSNSTHSTSMSSTHAAVGKAASKGTTAGMRNTKESSVLKVFISPDSGARWRLPGAGVVEFSPNAGQSWQGKLLDENAQLITGAAPGGKIFWIVGRGSVIYLTTNGTKWKKITPPVSADFVDISARDARFASVTTSDQRVFTTEDGGKNWTAAQ